MLLQSIFEKPIDRKIEGVIKADDMSSLGTELQEYVLTKEIEKRLEEFLDAYNNYAGVNGVWISGFFGSGKSHLLKMLAFLLEGKEIKEIDVLNVFLPKCQGNAILGGNLQKAAAIPSKSILFNIDQKADIISKDELDALLAVFVKVFNEASGYYGKQGHIAQFERQLDDRGLYDRFKQEYQRVAGKRWEIGREQALLESNNIAAAYAGATGDKTQMAGGILDRYRQEYRVSIEDFAREVKAFIDRQEPNFRLNFFVDEVGQYIANNVKLMTNLQTIAESLATKCQGQAWVIVTAQEDMDTVIGEMGQKQGNDFSKIQDRFSTRMKLTSRDVAEVIQKRLLRKNQEARNLLNKVYEQQVNNFKTLFDFADGAASYRNFQDFDHFIDCYPFIPYQFTLFQSSIQSLSSHNAFEGKHNSVGERSMLGVFQEVVTQLGDRPLGELATFDRMYEGISTTLKGAIQSSILRAEDNLDSPFAVRLLKTLFLVKYIKEFKATARNLRVLLLERFNEDLTKLGDRVQEGLNLLEQQTYIQRTGDVYEYLTEEEKDIEREIKNTTIENDKLLEELHALIFDRIIKTKKIRYGENAQDYPFSRKLDNQLFGREYELTVNIITPLNDKSGNEAALRMESMGRDELLVVLPTDTRLLADLLMYKKTEKYHQQNFSSTQQETVKRILSDKNYQNQERSKELEGRARALLGKAKLFVAGTEIEIGSEDALSRITSGFHSLIVRTYPNLPMLRGIAYKEEMIFSCLQHSGHTLLGNDATALDESEQETLNFVLGNQRKGVRTTVSNLIERFERKPYGWDYAAILCHVAKLRARDKIEIRSEGNLLEDLTEIDRVLRNSRLHENIILEPQLEFTASQIRALKEFYAEFFDCPCPATEAKAIAKEVQEKFKQINQELTVLVESEDKYPFLRALCPAITTLDDICTKSSAWYLTDLCRQEDALLDIKEQTIEPILVFMRGPQKEIYREARQLLDEQKPNLDYIAGELPRQIAEVLNDDRCFAGNRIQQVKEWVESVREQLTARVREEIYHSRERIEVFRQRLVIMEEFARLSEVQQQELTRPFEEYSESLSQEKLIAVIRDRTGRFETETYSELFSRLTAPTDSYAVNAGAYKAGEPKTEYISSRSLLVNFSKPWLENEEDVEKYLGAMKAALLAEIQQGKRVQI